MFENKLDLYISNRLYQWWCSLSRWEVDIIKANQDIRDLMRIKDIAMWRVALEYGCAESTFVKKLRIELSKQEKEKIIKIIEQLKR